MKTTEMEVGDIILNFLREHNHDGLYRPGECSCKIDDPFPCDSICADCTPGYFIKCDHKLCEQDYNFCIGASPNDDCLLFND